MDNMLDQKDNQDRNLKDTVLSIQNESNKNVSHLSFMLSYSKTSKLISALYMVTDIMEKEEPIRLKLRTLGTEIISDITFLSNKNFTNLEEKITAILSFLNISFDIGMISEMNYNILKKEFIELKESIQDLTKKKDLWLEDFIGHNNSNGQTNLLNVSDKGHKLSLQTSTRIGVQKGSTLMKALSKVGNISNMTSINENRNILKNKRRELILKFLKNKSSGTSIKDIMMALKSLGEECGEKTLQRELVSMVKDNVLKKTGDKRWSLYFLI